MKPSIVGLVGDGTLDAELAAMLWLLVEGRVPLVVASEDDPSGAIAITEACLDFLPTTVRVVEMAGEDETFGWLPQASELGWPGMAHPPAHGEPVRPDTAVLRAGSTIDDHVTEAVATVTRIAIRAASIGYGLVMTIRSNSLEGVFAALEGPAIAATADECSHLGVVLVVARGPDHRRRVTAAHYVRPVARDVHGHIQRLGPAVLATWDPAADTFEHFGWGVTPELARRVGRHAGDFEIELERRAKHLADLLTAGATDPQPARDGLRGYRPAAAIDAPEAHA